MTLKQTLKRMAILFFMATTFCFMFIGIQSTFFFPEMTYSGTDILTCILMAFLVTLPSLIFFRAENVSHINLRIRQILHFIFSAGAVFVGITLLDWVELDIYTALYAFLFFSVVYILGFTIALIREKRIADELNKRINAFHDTENVTHDK